MTIDKKKYSAFLEQIAREIDIPPSKYRDAVDRYESVGRWLENREYLACHSKPSIYVQGSFLLGTVTRPIRNGIEASYDIDLVCELAIQKDQTAPWVIKSMVGDRLRKNETYRKLLDPEGRRCWTLEYAEQNDVGFHLDVLPAVPDAQGSPSAAIAITNKENNAYTWSASNPRDYGAWFSHKNEIAFQRVVLEQKQNIQYRESSAYARVDKVPDRLFRTPLQRSIQIMKRHRDMRFNHHDRIDYAPISIIITTLAAHLYSDEPDVYSALSGIVGKLHAYAALVKGGTIDPTTVAMRLIQRRADGTWYIGNPVNPDENFADRWHEDNHARARAFFAWVDAIQEDLIHILNETNPLRLRKSLDRALGPPAVGKHFNTLVPPKPLPHIHITNPAQPWRQD